MPVIRRRPTVTSGSRPSSRVRAKPCSKRTAYSHKQAGNSVCRFHRSRFRSFLGALVPVSIRFPVTHDVEKNKKTRAAFRQLVQIAAEHGFGEYRTAPAYRELIMNTYSFNDHALRRFHERLKGRHRPERYPLGRAVRYLAQAPARGSKMITRLTLSLLTSAALLGIGSGALAANREKSTHGYDVFQKWCAPCHGRGKDKPGTVALTALYKGNQARDA